MKLGSCKNSRFRVRKALILFMAVASLFLAAGTALADKSPDSDKEIAPEDVVVSTPVYRPQRDKIDFPAGIYNYAVTWQGLPAADASISVEGSRSTR